MTNEDLIMQFVVDRDTAFTNAVMDDDWKGFKKFCKKYGMEIPKDKKVMKVGVYKAVRQVTSIPQEVKDVAFDKCIDLGFRRLWIGVIEMTNEEAILNCKIFCEKCKKLGINCNDCWRKNAIEALEKQIPKKPVNKWEADGIKHSSSESVCPNCHHTIKDEKIRINGKAVTLHCKYCGQAIDCEENNVQKSSK